MAWYMRTTPRQQPESPRGGQVVPPIPRLSNSGLDASTQPTQERNNSMRSSASTGRVSSAIAVRGQQSHTPAAPVNSRGEPRPKGLSTPLPMRRCGASASPSRGSIKKKADDPMISARGRRPGASAEATSPRQQSGQPSRKTSGGYLRSNSAKALTAGRATTLAAAAANVASAAHAVVMVTPASARSGSRSGTARGSVRQASDVTATCAAATAFAASSAAAAVSEMRIQSKQQARVRNASGSAELTGSDDTNCSHTVDAALRKSAQLLQELTSLTQSGEEKVEERLSFRSEEQTEETSIPSRIVTPTLLSRNWPMPNPIQKEVAQEMAEIWRAVRGIEQRLVEQRASDVTDTGIWALETSLNRALENLEQVAHRAGGSSCSEASSMPVNSEVNRHSSSTCCLLGSTTEDRKGEGGHGLASLSTTPTVAGGMSCGSASSTSRLSMPWSVGSTMTPQQSSRGSISIRDGSSITSASGCAANVSSGFGFDGFLSPSASSVCSLQHVSPRLSFGSRQLQRGSIDVPANGSTFPQLEVIRQASTPVPGMARKTPSRGAASPAPVARPSVIQVQSQPQVVWQPVVVTKVHQYLAWAPGSATSPQPNP